MENIVADFTISNENTINAEYSIEQDNFACSFEIYASGVVWGAITGNITDQTDLINILNEKATISYVDTNIQSEATSRAESDTLLQNNINTLSGNLTSEINARTLADNNLQTQIDNINNAGYITKDVNDLSYYMLSTDINTALNGKQNTISDLADIRNNAENGNIAYNTIQNYGDIVSYNATYFATASQGALADTSIQPNDNITLLNNNAGYITNSALNGYATETYVNSQGFITIDALDGYATEDFVTSQGYITGIDNADVVNALGYTPYDSSNPAGYITSASLPTVNNNTITIQKNSVTVDSFTLNQSSNKTINITVPTSASDVGALPNTTNYGASIDLSLNTTDYKLTLTLKDQDGTTLSTKTVDFPIESVVVNGSYDSTNQKIVLTLQNGTTIDVPVGDLVAGLQTEITSTNKLDADLVDDTNATNKFVTANEKTTWNNKQNAISDLSTIRTNATNGANAYTTIQGYGDIVTHNASEFVTPSSLTTILTDYVLSSDLSTTLANYVTSTNLTTILDDYATKQWVNNQGYITGITSSDVTTALGFTPYNATNPNGYITSSALTPYALISSLSTVATSGLYSDLTDLPTIPTMTSQLTNNSGFITSADLPTNYLTTDTAQDVSGRKTFLGEKAIYFKQIATSNKLGFTLYNPSNTELGALEYRPSTIGTSSLLAINCPQTTGGYVGFRYWGTPAVNIVAPKVATAGNYYIPTHITNGSTTVTASNNGTVNISTLMPDVSNFVTNSSLATTLANYTLSSSLATVATSGSYNDLSNKPTIPDAQVQADWDVTDTTSKAYIKNKPYIPSGVVVDQTYDGTSANAQSGVAIEGELGNYVKSQVPVSGSAYSDCYFEISNDGRRAIMYCDLTAHSSNCDAGIDVDRANSEMPVTLYYDDYNNDIYNGINITPSGIKVYFNGSGSSFNITDDNGSVDLTTSNNNLAVNGSEVALQSDIPDISTKQDTLVSGTNIKTINNTSILGSGNIDTSEIFVAEYGVTSYADVLSAYNNGKTLVCKRIITDETTTAPLIAYSKILDPSDIHFDTMCFIFAIPARSGSHWYKLYDNNSWIDPAYGDANMDLSNLSSTGKTVIDGQWVSALGSIITSSTSLNGSTALPYTITALPDDGNSYEVLLRCNALTGTSSGNMFRVECRSDLIDYSVFICGGQTRSNSYQEIAGSCILPVSSTRKIYVARNTSFNGNIQTLTMVAYRRIGTNS